jgi:hypothetical protein
MDSSIPSSDEEEDTALVFGFISPVCCNSVKASHETKVKLARTATRDSIFFIEEDLMQFQAKIKPLLQLIAHLTKPQVLPSYPYYQ